MILIVDIFSENQIVIQFYCMAVDTFKKARKMRRKIA